MKKLVLIFFASILLTSLSYAQNRNGLTGPKAKNFKSWQDNSEKSTVVYKLTSDQPMGPQAKNKSLRKGGQSEQYLAISTTSRANLTGPKAKNWKSWQSEQAEEKIYTKTASDKPEPTEKKGRDGEVDNDNF